MAIDLDLRTSEDLGSAQAGGGSARLGIATAAGSHQGEEEAAFDVGVRDVLPPDEGTVRAQPESKPDGKTAAERHAWLPQSVTDWAAKNAKGGDNFDKALKPVTAILPTAFAATALGVAGANFQHAEEKKT